MTTSEAWNSASRFLRKAKEYLDSAQDNLDLERATPAAGDAIHAGISAKDAIVMALTGVTSRAKDHAKAAGELRTALGSHAEAAAVEKALRELIASKSDVEYGASLVSLTKAEPFVRRARLLVNVAERVLATAR